MKNWLKKVLSLLTAIALLVSAGVLAIAEEPIDPSDVEEVVLNEEPTNDTPAVETAPEADPAAEETSNEETSNNGSSNEELPAPEAPSVQEETPVQENAPVSEGTTGEPEAEPVSSYNNSDETPAEGQLPADETPAEQLPPVDDTPVADTSDDSEDGVIVTFDEETGEKIYTDDEGTYFEDELTTFVDGDNGGSDNETIAAMGLEVTDEVKFADATWLSLNDMYEGTVNPENKAEFVIKWESGQSIVLGLEASNSDLDVAINGTDIKFEETESSEDQSGFAGTYKLNIVADTAYYIVLSSQSSVDYKLTVKDAFVAAVEENNVTEETKAEDATKVNNTEETVGNNSEENTEDNNNKEETPDEEGEGTEENIEGKDEDNKEDNDEDNDNNKEETPDEKGEGTKENIEGKNEDNNEDNDNNEETPDEEGEETEENIEGNDEDNKNDEEALDEEGNEDNNGEYNTDNETIVNEFPVISGWITIDTEAFDVGSTITLKANTEPELDGTAAWQTKVQNEKGEEDWEICGYGETLTIKLTKDNINSTYRFKMEGENYSEEYTLGSIREEDEENKGKTEPGADENPEAEVTEEESETDVSENEDEVKDHKVEIIEEVASLGIDIENDPETSRTIAHMKGKLEEYQGLDYTLQWQISEDETNWIDLEGETSECLNIVLSSDNLNYSWKLVVKIAVPVEESESYESEEPVDKELIEESVVDEPEEETESEESSEDV